MEKQGPIIVIDDDKEEHEILKIVFKRLNLKNEVVFFYDGQKALSYLFDTGNKPFFVLSDIRLPKLNGFDLREMMFERTKTSFSHVPFIFFTNGSNKTDVEKAYALSVQGIFLKPSTLTGIENTLRKIIDYWQLCISASYL